MALSLTVKAGEAVLIADGLVRITADALGKRVRLHVAAPPGVRVDREAVHRRRAEASAAARRAEAEPSFEG